MPHIKKLFEHTFRGKIQTQTPKEEGRYSNDYTNLCYFALV
jgi:hypothetical protein